MLRRFSRRSSNSGFGLFRASLILASTLTLSGCGAMHPHDMAASLDQQSPLYETEACKKARMRAENFNGRELERGGAGVAAGLLVGVVAAPFIALFELDAANLRGSVVEDLKRNCEGVMIIDATDPERRRLLPQEQAKAIRELEEHRNRPGSAAAQLTPDQRLARLQALLKDGLITQQEYADQRRAVLSGL